MKYLLTFIAASLIGTVGIRLSAQTDTDSDTASAPFDFGFDSDRFKPSTADTETETTQSEIDSATGASDTDSDSGGIKIAPFVSDCEKMRTDYVEIIDRPTPWQPRDDHVVARTVRWEKDRQLYDAYSECCWPKDAEQPKCDTREMPRDYPMPTVQWLGDATLSYLRLQPIDLAEFEENYRNRFSLDLRTTLSHNPHRGNTIWGGDMDLSVSLVSGESREMTADGYRLFGRRLNLYGAWRRMPLAYKQLKKGDIFYGRHFFGIHLRAGIIPQTVKYNHTAYDMPVYKFYGSSDSFETAETYRHPGAFTPGLLAGAGLTGRSRIGGIIESNNTYSLEVENAHVPALDINVRMELLGPTLLAANQSMAFAHPVTETYPQETQWTDAVSGLGDSMVFAPKANVGIVTKTDTARAHLGYTGEYTLQPTRTAYADAFGYLESDYRLSTVFFQLAMHLVEVEARYLRLKTIYNAPNMANGLTQTNNMFHGYLAFHVFQVLAKCAHRLSHYQHALSFYGEYLYKSRTPVSVTNTVHPWHVVPFKHGYKRGISSLIPLYPSLDRRSSHPHGVQIAFMADLSMTTIARDSYVTALAGIRVSPY